LCAHYGRSNHVFDKCWDKFGKPEWAQVADTTFTSTATSSNTEWAKGDLFLKIPMN